MKSLLIDDMRDINCDIIARDAESGIDALKNNYGSISELYLDHDLGSGPTGYDVTRIALDLGVMPRKIIVVSANPVGVENIARALVHDGYKRLGREFTK